MSTNGNTNMLIDTHAHLWFPDYYPAVRDQPDYYDDLDEVIGRAKAAGVEKMIVPGTNIESSLQAIELAKKYPGIIYSAVGIHPEDVDTNSSDLSFASLQTALRSKLRDQVVAIGEIGIDLYTEKERSTLEAQKVLFRKQCGLAIEFDLPVIIHTRDSFTETWGVLTSLPTMPRGQFHCFSVDEEALQKVIEAGFYVSFCGNITWSKRVAKLVPLVPDDRLLLETDSPFMKPRIAKIAKVPNSEPESSEPRNKRNEPANTKILAEKIAELRGQTTDKIEEMTTSNAKRLFHL